MLLNFLQIHPVWVPLSEIPEAQGALWRGVCGKQALKGRTILQGNVSVVPGNRVGAPGQVLHRSPA